MRKKWIVGALLFLMLIQNSGLAASIMMHGYTESGAKGATVLITKKDADIANLKQDDVIWIDQAIVKSDGSFSMKLPLFTDNEWDIRTNAVSHFFDTAESQTLYVSSSGSDSNDGWSETTPLRSLGLAQEKADIDTDIVLLDSVTFVNATQEYQKTAVIRGKTGTEVVTLPAEVNLKGNLKLENLKLSGESTIYANGYELEIASNVASANRMNVFGGGKNMTVDNTNIKLYGGLYNTIYGGGNSGKVTRKTNVVIGGSANNGDGIDDDASNISPCFVYGGGKNAAVQGSTNVTLEGNAVVKYLVGAGTDANGTATDTNIIIRGGKAMNVYGGSQSTVLNGCNTHITMTGGVAESLFGGCSGASMTGNTYITVQGGEVLRRIYTGCYNNADAGLLSLSWAATNNHVVGTTNLTIYPGAKLATGTGLSGTNGINRGIFAGSRRANGSDDEINAVIFADGSYQAHKGKLKELCGWFTSDFKSFHNYTVDAGTGGKVLPVSAGKVRAEFDTGMSMLVNGNRKFRQEDISLTKNAVCIVTFEGISSATVTETQTGADASVGITNRTSGQLVAAIYDENNALVCCRLATVDGTEETYVLNLNATLEKDISYAVKLFLWEELETMTPVIHEYTMQLR